MAFAGHPAKVEVSTDGIAWNEVDGINDFSFTPDCTILDTTDFKDTSGAHTRIYGLINCAIEFSGDYEDTDTNGQNVIRTAFLNGTALHVGIKFDGTDGLKCQVVVESYEIAAGVDDKVTFSVSLQSNSTISAHS